MKTNKKRDMAERYEPRDTSRYLLKPARKNKSWTDLLRDIIITITLLYAHSPTINLDVNVNICAERCLISAANGDGAVDSESASNGHFHKASPNLSSPRLSRAETPSPSPQVQPRYGTNGPCLGANNRGPLSPPALRSPRNGILP